MKTVVDRIVQYPNRYKLTNVETGAVLGTFDFDEVTGTVQQVGTEINAELFESIKTDLSSLFTNTTNLKNDSFASVEISGNTVTFKNKDGIVLGEFTIEQVHYDDATQDKSGLMSGQDKLKLDGIENGAQANTVEPTGTYSEMTVGNATNAENADKVNHALTISTDTEPKTYDGSAEVNITIPPATEVKTSAEWESQNPVLGAGKFGYDTTNKITKIGDGTTAWADLNIVETKPKPTFADSDWATIAELSENGQAQTFFSVGDEKTISLTTGEQVTLVVLGFDHDDLTGGGKAGMSIGMKNLLATKYCMHVNVATNAGGWDESEMRTSTMATLLSQLPSDLQGVIKQVNKKATAGSQSENITTSADKLWLLAMSEIFSATSIENSSISPIANYADAYNAEGTQYKYYENLIGDNNGGTATNSLLIKKLSNGSGSADNWWLRSPQINSSTSFWEIGWAGSVSSNGARGSHGVSFGFCV